MLSWWRDFEGKKFALKEADPDFYANSANSHSSTTAMVQIQICIQIQVQILLILTPTPLQWYNYAEQLSNALINLKVHRRGVGAGISSEL